MKALIKKHAEAGLWYEDVPEPQYSSRDVLIKVKQSSICGTDVHIFKWDTWSQQNIKTPMVIGHEFFGEIAQVGKDVTGLKVGQRVSAEGHITCGHCRSCRAGSKHLCLHTVGLGVGRPGAYAEYVSMPAENVFPLPEGISDDEATILDPLGNAVHTALSFDVVGEDVLVTGAGPIGIMSACIAQKIGARKVVITDISPYRLDLAKKLQIQHVLDVSQTPIKDMLPKLGMSEGFDVAFEMSGTDAGLQDIFSNSRPGAKIAMLGIFKANANVNMNDAILKGFQLKGITGREIFETWYKMCALIQSGLNIKPVITHRFHYSEFQKAFELAGSGQSGKIVFSWT